VSPQLQGSGGHVQEVGVDREQVGPAGRGDAGLDNGSVAGPTRLDQRGPVALRHLSYNRTWTVHHEQDF
jgi:hypothetical protein